MLIKSEMHIQIMHQLKINAAQNGIYWSGYKNLEHLLNGSLQGFLIHTSTLYDKLFYKELSDEFWLTECKYLLFN